MTEPNVMSREDWADLKFYRNLTESGRYAVHDREYDRWRFFRVDQPESGRWQGYTFINEQAGDEFYPIKHPDRQLDVLAMITDDPDAAMQAYGQLIGRCALCNKQLTDEESRRIGIGPVCREERINR